MKHVAAYLVHWRAPSWCRESVMCLLDSSGVTVKCSVVNNEGDLDLPDTVAVVPTGSNLGFAGGANVALTLSMNEPADYIFVGCHDIRLDRNSLSRMVQMLDNDDTLGIVGPILDGEGGSESNLEWISGAGMLMRREVANAVRFNVKFGSYVEDVDFCYRTRSLGWRIGRCGGTSATTSGSIDESRKFLLMNANTIAWHLHEHQWRAGTARIYRMWAGVFVALGNREYRRSIKYLSVLWLSMLRWVQISLSG